ncbi:MAG: TfoX/Sxy family protein [Thermodesulfobacteriota bacterium]
MSVSKEYVTYVLDQLESSGSITVKKMFGGAGLYLESVFFALISNDTLYFKVDNSNQQDYERAGMEAFMPFGIKSYIMHYYEVPVDVLDDKDKLKIWADKACSVAKRKLTEGKKRKRGQPHQIK